MDFNNPLTLDESVKQVMQTLPPVIRDYLAQGKYTPVAQNLMKKYSLRIDQGGILEREMMLLLMGIETPEEFVQALGEEAKIPPEAVGNIVQDINTQVFIPLREEEKRGPVQTAPPKPSLPPPPKPMPTPLPKPPMPNPQSAQMLQKNFYAPPLQSPSYPNQPIPEPNITYKQPIKSETPPARPVPPPQARPTAAPQMTDPSKLLEDHEEPHIEFHDQSAASQPIASSVPPNLPGAMPLPPRPEPSAPKAPPPPPQPASYTIDPYREPIDDHEK